MKRIQTNSVTAIVLPECLNHNRERHGYGAKSGVIQYGTLAEIGIELYLFNSYHLWENKQVSWGISALCGAGVKLGCSS